MILCFGGIKSDWGARRERNVQIFFLGGGSGQF